MFSFLLLTDVHSLLDVHFLGKPLLISSTVHRHSPQCPVSWPYLGHVSDTKRLSEHGNFLSLSLSGSFCICRRERGLHLPLTFSGLLFLNLLEEMRTLSSPASCPTEQMIELPAFASLPVLLCKACLSLSLLRSLSGVSGGSQD